MASDNQLRNEWNTYKCSPGKLDTALIGGRQLQVAPPTIEAWNALSAVLSHHGYAVRKSDTGSYNCRNIGGTHTPSLHSYGIAVDINWNTNPFKRTPDRRAIRYSSALTQDGRANEVRAGRADTDMTPTLIADILAIKTKDGDGVFDWGGTWQTIKDAMHFELDLGPTRLAVGIDWTTVVGATERRGDAESDETAEGDGSTLKAYGVTARSGLRMRAGNGTEFEILGLIPLGAIVYELKREGKWSIIDRTGDGTADGSAHNSFLKRAPEADRAISPAGDANERQEGESASEFLFLNGNHTATDLMEDSHLSVYLDTAYKPHKGWKIEEHADRGFTVVSDELGWPITLGKSTSFLYRDRGFTTRGLGRPWYDGTPGHISFNPDDWNDEFDNWPELLFPTAFAESGADFSVINAWDLAGFTIGFIQLAAHTGDDLISFFKLLLSSLDEEAEKYFPELTLINGELCYRRSGNYRRLEVRTPAADPIPRDLVDRGLFVSYFNKNRQMLGEEELHAAARWLVWTQESENMRRLQVAASVDNMRDSLTLLHRTLVADAGERYPRGVDGMRCDHLAAALAVPHLAPRRIDKAVWALLQPDPLQAFLRIEYGPGDREKNVVHGVRKRGNKLATLTYDLSKGHPV
jgi:hypothetical protein